MAKDNADEHDSLFVINDIGLRISPTNIDIQKRAFNFEYGALRSRTPQKVKSNTGEIIVSFSVPFIDLQKDINETLLPLIAQFRVTPFCFIDNQYIRDNLAPNSELGAPRNIALTLKHLVLEMSSNAPGTIWAHFEFLYFNYLPFSKNFEFKSNLIPSKQDGLVLPVDPIGSQPWFELWNNAKNVLGLQPVVNFEHGITFKYNEYAISPDLQDLGRVTKQIDYRDKLLDLLSTDKRESTLNDARNLLLNSRKSDNPLLSEMSKISELAYLLYQQSPLQDSISFKNPNDFDPEFLGVLPDEDPVVQLFQQGLDSKKTGAAPIEPDIDRQVRELAQVISRQRSTVDQVKNNTPGKGYIPVEGVNIDAQDGTGLKLKLYRRTRNLFLGGSIIPTSIQIEFSNKIAVLPLIEHVYPTHQYMGGNDIKVHIGMEIKSDEGLKKLQTMYETIESNGRHARHFPQNVMSVLAKNSFIQLCGLSHFLTENLTTSASYEKPGTYTGTLTLTDITKEHQEKLKQENIISSNQRRLAVIKNIDKFIGISSSNHRILDTPRLTLFNKFRDARGHKQDKSIQARYTSQLLNLLGRAFSLAGQGPKAPSKAPDYFVFSGQTTPNMSEYYEEYPFNLATNTDGIFLNQYNIVNQLTEMDLIRDTLMLVNDTEVLGSILLSNIVRANRPSDASDTTSRFLQRKTDYEALDFERKRIQFLHRQGIVSLSDDPSQITKDDLARPGLNDAGQIFGMEGDIPATINPQKRIQEKLRNPFLEFTRIAKGLSPVDPEIVGLQALDPVESLRLLIRPISQALATWADLVISTGAATHMKEELGDLAGLGMTPGESAYPDFKDLVPSRSASSLGLATDPLADKQIFFDPDFYFFNEMSDRGLFEDFTTDFARAKETAKAESSTQIPTLNEFFKNNYIKKLPESIQLNIERNYINTAVKPESFPVLRQRDGDLVGDSITNATNSSDFGDYTLSKISDKSQIDIKSAIRLRSARSITNRGDPFQAFGSTEKIDRNIEEQSKKAFGQLDYPLPKQYKPNPMRLFSRKPTRHPIHNDTRPHLGIDFSTGEETVFVPIFAAADGNITEIGWQDISDHKKGFGFRIWINHPELNLQTVYAHLDGTLYSDALPAEGGLPQLTGPNAVPLSVPVSISVVNPLSSNIRTPIKGQKIKRGEIIGYVGTTGGSTGNHLHFEVRLNNGKKPVDPMPYLKGQQIITPPNLDTEEHMSIFDLSFRQLLHELKSQQGQRMIRAYPTFKLYFIEPDQYEDKFKFDDFFDYNSVEEITIIKDRNIPADLAYIKLTNVSGLLSNRKFGDQSLDEQGKSRDGIAFDSEGKRVSDMNNDPIRNNTENENPIASLMLKEGTHIELRLGYATDPNQLETVFIGKIAEVEFSEGDDLVEIICQSFGTELVQVLKGTEEGDNPDGQIKEGRHERGAKLTGNTTQLLTNMISEPELQHFGRYNNEPGFRSPNSKLLLAGSSLNTEVNDDNIFVPRDVDIFAWKKKEFSILGKPDGGVFTQPGVTISERGSTVTSSAQQKDLNYWLYQTTVWDVFKEMELRHPGWIAAPLPYKSTTGTRMTMFFGEPHQLYFARDQMHFETLQQEVLQRLVEDFGSEVQNTIEQLDLLDGNKPVDAEGLRSLLEKDGSPVSDGDSKQYIDAYMRRLSETLATRIGNNGPQIKPFRSYHLLTGKHHIIRNALKASRFDMHNTITVQYSKVHEDINPLGDRGSFDKKLNQFIYDKNDQAITVKVDAALPDDEVQELYIQYPSCEHEEVAYRYAIGTLMNELRNMYKGSLTIIGNPNIKVGDICFINDNYNNIVGSIEVDRVVHTLSKDMGFITDIKPSLVVHVNETRSLLNKDIMGIMAASIYNRLAMFDLEKPVQILQNGAGTINNKPINGRILNPTLEQWGAIELSQFMAAKVATYDNYAGPILMSPLLYHGKPWLAGIAADKIKAKLWLTRFGQWVNEGVTGLVTRYNDWYNRPNMNAILGSKPDFN